MDAAARPAGRRDPAGGAWRSSASRCISRPATTDILGEEKVDRASGCRNTPRIDCDMVVVAAGIRPNVEIGRDQRPDGRARHRGRRPDARPGRGRHLRRRRVRPAPRRGVRPGRPAVGAGQVLADHLTGRTRGRLPRLADRHQAQGGRRRRGLDGSAGAGARQTTSRSCSPSPRRASSRRWSSATTGWSARPCSAIVQGRVPDAGLRPWVCRCRTSGSS